MTLLNSAKELQPYLQNIRRELHQFPEISLREEYIRNSSKGVKKNRWNTNKRKCSWVWNNCRLLWRKTWKIDSFESRYGCLAN